MTSRSGSSSPTTATGYRSSCGITWESSAPIAGWNRPRRIDILLDEILEFYKVNPITYDVVELRNISIAAKLIIECALQRKESRGLHYNVDYPQKDDAHWLKNTVLQSEDA